MYGIEEVCNKTFEYSYSGITSIEHRTVKSQLSKCYASLAESNILFFCHFANLAFCCFCCFCCCCGGGGSCCCIGMP